MSFSNSPLGLLFSKANPIVAGASMAKNFLFPSQNSNYNIGNSTAKSTINAPQIQSSLQNPSVNLFPLPKPSGSSISTGQQTVSLSKPTPPSANYNYSGGGSSGGGGNNNQQTIPTGSYNDGNGNWITPTTTSNSNFSRSSYNSTPQTNYSVTQSNPYDDQLKALQDKISGLNDSFSQYLKPSQQETDAQNQLDALTGQQRNLSASEALGLANIQAKPIALGFQQGQSAAVQRQAAAQMGALGAQAEPLSTQLARLQSQRQNQADIAKYQLGNIQSQYSNLRDQYKPQEIAAGGSLVRLNPTTGQYETIAQGQPKNSDANIQEYNLAKQQGYQGTILDYQKEKATNGNSNPVQVGQGGTLVDPKTGRVIYQGAGANGTSNMNELLSPSEAKELGIPYGTTRGQAAQMGITPRGTGGQQTPDQLKAADFATRMQGADQIINQLGNVGASGIGNISGNKYFPNALKTSDRQQLEQAQRTFLNAVLRRESGAAISPEEFDSGSQQYFPQPGDSAQVLQQKSALRAQVTQSMQSQAGGGGQQGNGSQIDPQELQQLRSAGYSDQQIQQIHQMSSQQGFNSPLNTGLKGSIAQKYPEGSQGGQCASFARKLVDIPPMGDSLKEKEAHVNQIGIPADQWRQNPQVGDAVVTNDSPINGHMFVVNKILPGGKVQVSESNFHLNEKVTHNRIVSLDSSHIYGAIRAPLKV